MKKVIICGILIVLFSVGIRRADKSKNVIDTDNVQVHTGVYNKKIDDWELTLVNHNNVLPDDFEIELANIDSTRQFDARAIDELNQMLKAMKEDGIHNVWVQSAYRSIAYQEGLFNEQINICNKEKQEKKPNN